jgi:succinoglycan biosynthesis transport protein ExoP
MGTMPESPIGPRPHDVRGYLRILRRRKWVVAASVAVTTLVAVVVAARQEPSYVSASEVRIVTAGTDNNQEELDTEVRLMESDAITSLAAEQVPSLPPLDAALVTGTSIIRVEVTSTDPELAAQAANAYVQAYLRYSSEQARARLLASAEATQAKIDGLRPQIAAVTAELDAQRAQIDQRYPPTLPGEEGAAILRQNQAERARLDEQLLPQLNNLNAQLFVLESQLYNTTVDEQYSTAEAEVVSAAQVPSTPVSPDPLRSGMIGAVLGLVLGVGAALAFEHLDDRIRSRADVERFVGTQPPVLAAIPRLRLRAGREIVDGSSPPELEEVYRSLRTSVDFLSVEDPFGVTMVTGPTAGEGKTVTIGNLATVTARGGRRVVLIDCDLRRARVHELFGLPNDVGLTSVLLGTVALDQALQQVPGIPRLHVLTSGPLPPNPSELLSLARFGKVVSLLRANARVFLDAPAVLPVTDPLVLSAFADRSLVVVRAEHTTGGQLRRTLELLGRGVAPVAGLVLTAVHDREGDVPPSYLQRSEKHTRSRHPSRRRHILPTNANETHPPDTPSPAAQRATTNGAHPPDTPSPAAKRAPAGATRLTWEESASLIELPDEPHVPAQVDLDQSGRARRAFSGARRKKRDRGR